MHLGRTPARPLARPTTRSGWLRRGATASLGLALAVGIGLVPSSPAQAEPDIEDVRERVDRLFHQAEQASERYNDARLELAGLTEELESLEADEERQDEQLETVRERLADAVVQQYEGQDLSAAGQVLLSDDSGAFLSQLSAMSAYSDFQDELYDEYSTEADALSIREDATRRRADQVAALEERLADEKKRIELKHSEATTLLEDLEAEERAKILDSGGTEAPSNVPASGRAAAAVDYAMAQVGDAYVYGAAGPDAFDCSGLTMMAWAQAGVSLPHSSSAQYGTGTRVSEGDLQAGDLVFYYSPISHVGMYIGSGLIVHAANPGAGVRVAELHSMPYVGAVRPG